MFRSLMALVVAVALAGCSLVNPYVIDRNVRDPRPPDKPRVETVNDPSQMTFQEASAYAARVKQRYRDALGDQAKLQNWLGIGLIPLAAAAMGLGVSGAHTTEILALGLTGAAGFGTATWLSNRPRSAAYAAGIKAVTCAEQAVTPLALPDLMPKNPSDPNDRTAFDKRLDELAALIPLVTQDIAAVQATAELLEREITKLDVKQRGPFTVLLTEAREQIATSRSLVSSSDTAYLAGRDLARTVRGLGRRLADAVEGIVATVDGIITDTQRDPQALATIVSSLGGAYRVLTTVPESVKATAEAGRLTPHSAIDLPGAVVPEPVEKLHGKLTTDLQKLRADSALLEAARRDVAAVINSVSKDAPLKALEGCGVKPGDIVTAVVIDPAGPLRLTKPGSVGFVVRGGVSPYVATIAGPGSGVTLSLAGSFSAYNVTATAEATNGTYVVTILDSTLKEGKTVEVTVGPASTGGGAAPTPPVPGEKTDQSNAFTDFRDRVKDKIIRIDGTDFELKVTDVKPGTGNVKALVTLTVVKSDPAKLGDLTREALNDALLKLGTASGLIRGQIDVADLAALQAQAEKMAKPAAATTPAGADGVKLSACDTIGREKDVTPASEPNFSGPTVAQATRERIQIALCFKPKPNRPDEKIDGLWGPYTKMKLAQYQCRTKRTPDGKLTDELKKELLARSGEELAKDCR